MKNFSIFCIPRQQIRKIFKDHYHFFLSNFRAVQTKVEKKRKKRRRNFSVEQVYKFASIIYEREELKNFFISFPFSPKINFRGFPEKLVSPTPKIINDISGRKFEKSRKSRKKKKKGVVLSQALQSPIQIVFRKSGEKPRKREKCHTRHILRTHVSFFLSYIPHSLEALFKLRLYLVING